MQTRVRQVEGKRMWRASERASERENAAGRRERARAMGAAARRNSYEFHGIPLSGGARFDVDAMWRDAALAYGGSPYPHRRATCHVVCDARDALPPPPRGGAPRADVTTNRWSDSRIDQIRNQNRTPCGHGAGRRGVGWDGGGTGGREREGEGVLVDPAELEVTCRGQISCRSPVAEVRQP